MIMTGGACEATCTPSADERDRWQRRARPLLGTLVEVGTSRHDPARWKRCIDAAFDAIASVQTCLSRFEPLSDIAAFHALEPGRWMVVRPHTTAVLAAAQRLHRESGGRFDVSLGSARDGWLLDGSRLQRRSAAATLDLGGIGKGYAVDAAVEAMQAVGCESGWVNAGGDLRTFGSARLTLLLRDEASGGVRPFATLRDGSFATSHFGPNSRNCLANGSADGAGMRHISVASPQCMWSDALTKVVAASGDCAHSLLSEFGAQAWLH
nr:ApbE family [uncultured bacterium]